VNRFFVKQDNIFEDRNNIIINNPEDVRHLSKVLRLAQGDQIEISDMNNKEYIAEIINIDKNSAACRIIKSFISDKEPPIEIILFQSVPKSNKMDFIVQKSVEIGVKKIIPILTERCIVKIKDKKSENKKVDRWQKIAMESAKQCKRAILPQVESVLDFSDIEKRVKDFDLILIPYELERKRGIKSIIKSKSNYKKVGIIIGPEGGFSDEEVRNAINWGIEPISLGPRILRTETAGIVTASILMYELGDLGGS
jgi:16S rRNA (uracil1498-N3)-methyltransferase